MYQVGLMKRENEKMSTLKECCFTLFFTTKYVQLCELISESEGQVRKWWLSKIFNGYLLEFRYLRSWLARGSVLPKADY